MLKHAHLFNRCLKLVIVCRRSRKGPGSARVSLKCASPAPNLRWIIQQNWNKNLWITPASIFSQYYPYVGLFASVGVAHCCLSWMQFACRCHICTDLAWNCHVTFSKSFADYNELPEISRAICRQYIASGCEKDMTCCTGLRYFVG